MEMKEITIPVERKFIIEINMKEAYVLSVALEKLAITHSGLSFISDAQEMREVIMRCKK